MYHFYFYKQCQLMKCCCWHKQWFEMAHVPLACAHLSVCTSKTCIRCNKLVQVSAECTQGQQNILWLYSVAYPPPRLQTSSVTFLTKLSEAESPSLFWWPGVWSTLMPTSQSFNAKVGITSCRLQLSNRATFGCLLSLCWEHSPNGHINKSPSNFICFQFTSCTWNFFFLLE